MWIASPKTVSRIVISGILLLGSVACGGDPETTSTKPASPVVKVKATPSPVAKRPVKTVASLSAPATKPNNNNYEKRSILPQAQRQLPNQPYHEKIGLWWLTNGNKQFG